MARTGRRAQALQTLLKQVGLRPAASVPPRPDGSSHHPELLEMYRQLGGLQQRPTLRPGPWDLSFDDGLVIELDEELHFNRWRAATLETSWSAALPWTAGYRRHCAAHEVDCLRAGQWGRRWTSTSAARMFSGGPPGKLDGNGAPRWKQRAIYDAIKDTAPAGGTPLSRLSVWDRLEGGVLLGDVLDDPQADPRLVLELVERRRAPMLEP